MSMYVKSVFEIGESSDLITSIVDDAGRATNVSTLWQAAKQEGLIAEQAEGMAAIQAFTTLD